MLAKTREQRVDKIITKALNDNKCNIIPVVRFPRKKGLLGELALRIMAHKKAIIQINIKSK